VVFAKIVTLKIANGTEHSVSLRYTAVASLSSAYGIREFRVEKFMPAFCATERIEFSAYTVSCHWLVPMKLVTALLASTFHDDFTIFFIEAVGVEPMT